MNNIDKAIYEMAMRYSTTCERLAMHAKDRLGWTDQETRAFLLAQHAAERVAGEMQSGQKSRGSE